MSHTLTLKSLCVWHWGEGRGCQKWLEPLMSQFC